MSHVWISFIWLESLVRLLYPLHCEVPIPATYAFFDSQRVFKKNYTPNYERLSPADASCESAPLCINETLLCTFAFEDKNCNNWKVMRWSLVRWSLVNQAWLLKLYLFLRLINGGKERIQELSANHYIYT